MSSNDSDSDYNVEDYIKPDKIAARPRNDERGDILGNFDDAKLLEKNYGSGSEDEDDDNSTARNNKDGDDSRMLDIVEESSDDDEPPPSKYQKHDATTGLSTEQMEKLLTGTSKLNRHVLYVTCLSSETTKESLNNFFSQAGTVKSIRIPKTRKSLFAFVEMADMVSFQSAFKLHNHQLDGRQIKVQISEAGKKKSANKKNIIKQKNRCLAEMRNEAKSFLKSGKTFGLTKTAKNRAMQRSKEKKK